MTPHVRPYASARRAARLRWYAGLLAECAFLLTLIVVVVFFTALVP